MNVAEVTDASGRTAAAGGGPARRKARKAEKLRTRMRKHAWHYVFLVPMTVLFLSFTLWPMVASWWYSLYDWGGIGPPSEWVGFGNYQEVLSSPAFWNAFRISLIFSAVAIFVQLPLALVMAVILNNPRLRGRNLYRLLIFLPVVTTTAVVGIVFAMILDPAGGIVNEVMSRSGLIDEPINFLGSESTALPTLLGIDLWKGFGITMVYWLAALQTVPSELYEAARVDGASARQTLLRVTIPVLAPLAIVILLLTFQTSMAPFDLVQATTQGGPNFSTDVMSTYIYRYAFDPSFSASRYGFASAAGVVFGIFMLILTLMQAPLLRKRYERRGK
ncbi:carbohydrate ABC transporter permease [Phytoactinopolyspora endophytica]|uniref:carbohydrate ABC transporter permease n=1 Tax=Phytoactinopolyspora endophytica TaxID=1642495 RepID=UPI00197C6D87|nr:sugar ABC transporter permease [Phytoactinopolyspora endophytica]